LARVKRGIIRIMVEKNPRSKNVHIRYYASICERLGIPYSLDLRTRILRLVTKTGKKVFCYKASTPLNTQAAVTASKNKLEVHRLLEPAGFPVPQQIRVRTFEELLPFFQDNQKIVVKPADSHGGKGVTVLPKEEELEVAFVRARKESNIVLAEEYVTGKNYRFLVLDGKVLAVALRQPPLVHGDGKTSLSTLLEDFNIENKANGLPKVPDSPYTWEIVAAQGFTRESTPPLGSEVLLRLTANLSLGGTVHDVTDNCAPAFNEIAVKATHALGLRLAGIDMISNDITNKNSPTYILEANAAPGMRIHYKCPKGAKRDVASHIISALYDL